MTRIRKPLLLLLVLIGVVVPAALIRKQMQKTDTDQKPALAYPFPMSRHDIRGFHYEGRQGNKRVIAVTADRLTIEKKKIGWLRFGMLSRATLHNAKIRIFAGSAGERMPTSQSIQKIFSGRTLPVLSMKRISIIEMKPVLIEVMDENAIISTIRADSSLGRLTQKDVLFQGHVTATAGFRILTTDELRLVPGEAVFEMHHPYKLLEGNICNEGTSLTTDLGLHPIRRQPEKQVPHNPSGVLKMH